MRVIIFLFDGVTALDAIGAYDPIARLPNTDIVFATEDGAPARSGDGLLSLTATCSIADIHRTDILLVPGGSAAGLVRCMGDARLRSIITRLDGETAITASVCTGSLILAAFGLLQGRRAATNWRAKDYLARYGAVYSGERVTKAGKYWTASGVTAGIDLGLALCTQIAGDDLGAAVELAMEYDPAPPFGTGNPFSAADHLKTIVSDVLRG